jgi:APA family basic amino acid/polyamine antiporter
MALSAGSIFVIRKRTKHLNGTGIFSMKLYPLLPLVFIAAYMFVAIAIALDYEQNGYAAAIGTAVLLFFTVLYFLIRKKQSTTNDAA